MAFTPAGFEGTVNEAQFVDLMTGGTEHGLLGTYNDASFAATRVAGARQMLIQPGKVNAPGVTAHLDTATNSPASSSNSSGNPRIDVVVARFDWSANSVALQVVEGTPAGNPEPPAITVSTAGTIRQNPGTLFEVPLWQSRLGPSAAEYTVADVAVGSRRYWIQGGRLVMPTTTILPANKAGRIVYRPDGKQFLLSDSAAWEVFKAHQDTGVLTIGSAPGGTTGTLHGQKLNGIAYVQAHWTKTGGAVSNISFTFPWPSGWAPRGLGITGADITAEISVTNPVGRARLYVGTDGVAGISALTANVGAGINFHVTYPV